MSRPPNLCVYCGKPGITKEHIRGAWSVKYGRSFDRTSHTLSMPSIIDHNIRMNIQKGAADRPGGPRSLTLKIACKVCNEGWMKAIQDEAIPILKLMMHGYWGTPQEKELTALIKWIILYSMSYEFVDRKTVCVDFEERDRFRRTLEPSGDWQIAIGYAETLAWDDRTFHRAIETVEPSFEGNKKSHFTAFLFGKLIVMSHYSACPLPINFPHICRDMGLAVLWPELPKRVIKPHQVHIDESVSLLISRFSDELQKKNGLLLYSG